MDDVVLNVRGISKTFASQTVLRNVGLSVAAGEIVGLVGQNGSGKSTLIKILAGYHEADSGGAVELRGRDGEGGDPEMHFIHQDLGLVESLSTIENLDLTRPLGRRGWLPSPTRRETDLARGILAEFGVDIDVRAPVSTLTRAEQTIVAIARALHSWRSPRGMLVLDESTESLHGNEVQRLFGAVRSVAERGAGVIFVSHRLEEVLDLAHKVVVLRDGVVVLEASTETMVRGDLIRALAGPGFDPASLAAHPVAGGVEARPVVLRAEGIEGSNVRDVSLAVRAGEVVGIAGIIGSGREHVAGMVFGAHPRGGTVSVDGAVLAPSVPAEAVRVGVSYVPADRRRLGAMMTMSVQENMTLPWLQLVSRHGRVKRAREREIALEWAERLELRPPDPDMTMSQLSGGNQQKVLLAKWLHNSPRVLLLDEPTQGIDVAAKVAVYQLIAQAARAGAAVVVCSGDVKELSEICDRVLVLRDGRGVAECRQEDLTEARLIQESLGLHESEAARISMGRSEEGDG